MSGLGLESVGEVLDKYADSDAPFLELLKRVKTALETSVTVRVPVEQIQRYKAQPRKYFNAASLKRLSNGIAAGGQIQAGLVRRLKESVAQGVLYELVDGERRWLAVGMIPAEKRPLYKAEIIDAEDDVIQFLIAGMANFNREGHQPLETADTIDRYRKHGIPMEAVADLLGVSQNWAYDIHGLLKLCLPVQELLSPDLDKSKRLQLTAAIHIAKLNNPQQQLELAQRVIRGDITLMRLRGEIVNVAEETDTHLRVRTVSPANRWAHRNEKVDAIARLVSNLEDMLGAAEMKVFIGAHPSEAGALAIALGSVQRTIDRCVTLLGVKDGGLIKTGK